MESNNIKSPEQIALDFEAEQSAPANEAKPVIETTEPSAEDIAAVEEDIAREKKYGGQPVKAALAGAARGLTFGISDQALVKSGLVDPQTLRELEERNKAASVTGEAAGVVLPSIATLGATAPVSAAGVAVRGAAAAGKAVEELTAKSLGKLITQTGNKKLATEILKKSLPKVAGSAVEGGFYGAGQLISEDALGTQEFNAENLLASVGTGAIIGGLAGGAFGSLEAIVPTVKKGGALSVGKGKAYLDPETAALELSGLSPAKITKMRQVNPQLVKDLPEFYRKEAELGLLTTDRKLTEVVSNIKEKAGQEIGNILKKVEDVSARAPEILPTKKSIYTKIISDLDENFLNKYKNVPEYADKLAPIRKIRNSYNELASSAEGVFKPIELNNLRKELDAVIKYDKIPGTISLAEKANKGTRNILRNEIDTIADKASQNTNLADEQSLFNQLKEQNKRFSIATTILPHLEGKLDKQKLFNNMDMLKGAGLIGVLHETGAAIAAGMKLAESDIARRFKILTQIEKTNQKVSKDINKSVKDYIKLPKKAAVPTSVNILMNTAYGRENIDGKKPNSKLEAFKNMQTNFSNIKKDPDALFDKMNINTLRLSKHAPNTFTAITGNIMNAMTFLQEKMPKDPRQQGAFDFRRAPWEPSSTQLAKFERYVEAVEHPLNILKDIESGSVSPEQVETLATVYPDLYSRIQREVMDQITTSNEPVPYSKRLQLGLLLNIPTDSSLNGPAIAQLQTAFAPVQEQTQSSIPGSNIGKLDVADISTQIEKVQTRNNKA